MNFFSQLFRYNKSVFWGVLSFSILTLAANFLKVETTPFFVWGMYSENEKPVDTYNIIELVVNDSVLIDYSSGFTDANRFYLLSPLTYSMQIRQQGGVDPQEQFLRQKAGRHFTSIDAISRDLFNDAGEQNAFPAWYLKYLQETIHFNVDHLQLNELALQYNDQGYPILMKKTPLATWKK